MYKNILIPYDKSDHAHGALKEATRFARADEEVTLRIITIVDLDEAAREEIVSQNTGKDMSAFDNVNIPELYEDAVEQVSHELHNSIDHELDDLSNQVIVELIEHIETAGQIVAYADEKKCDLIIMGSRGLGRFQGILGSVSSEVLREANVPVLIVKDK